jgi:hypothetical protein
MFILASHISSSTVSRSSRLCPGRGTLDFKRLHRQAGQLNAISDELWQRGTWLYGFAFSDIGPPLPSSLKLAFFSTKDGRKQSKDVQRNMDCPG